MKKWYESKTVIANLLTILVGVLALIPAFVNDVGISEHTAKVIITSVLFFSNVLNIILRMLFTKETISNGQK